VACEQDDEGHDYGGQTAGKSKQQHPQIVANVRELHVRASGG
jgi:hypothetical protein